MLGYNFDGNVNSKKSFQITLDDSSFDGSWVIANNDLQLEALGVVVVLDVDNLVVFPEIFLGAVKMRKNCHFEDPTISKLNQTRFFDKNDGWVFVDNFFKGLAFKSYICMIKNSFHRELYR